MVFNRPKKSVLIVDDDRDFAAAAAALLDGFARVTVAADGTGALRIARRLRPDLVVLDVNLPDINGFRVCRSLRDDASFDGKIMMLTIRSADSDKTLGSGAGADDYMQKPISNEEFAARVRELLYSGAGA